MIHCNTAHMVASAQDGLTPQRKAPPGLSGTGGASEAVLQWLRAVFNRPLP
jgi:hypothetical protein